MADSKERTLTLNGKKIVYTLERKKVKNLNLRVRSDGSVYVSANRRIAVKQIEQFMFAKRDFILQALAHWAELAQAAPPPRQLVSGESFPVQGRPLSLCVSENASERVISDGAHIYLQVGDIADWAAKRRLLNDFFDQQCRLIFSKALAEIYPLFREYGFALPALRIRNMKTRWGSCSPAKGAITLNKRLLPAPKICLDYVITHELCHFIQPNHSPKFYELLTGFMPDWREYKASLEQSAADNIYS